MRWIYGITEELIGKDFFVSAKLQIGSSVV